MDFARMPEQPTPHEIEQDLVLDEIAVAVLGRLPRWRAGGLRDEALDAVRFHADGLREDPVPRRAHHLARRAHAYALAVLLSFHADTDAGHLATDLFELLAV